MMRRVFWCAATVLLGGCDEIRTPAPATRMPPVLAAGHADPVRVAVEEIAQAFGDAGASLLNQPARTARAVAQLELVTAEFARDLRWAPLPGAVRFEMRAARLELRAALGTRANADPDAVVRALAAAHASLMRNDIRAAAEALPATLFEPGGNVTLSRLAQPGTLPQARNATALARDEVDRMQRRRLSGIAGALDPNADAISPQSGLGGVR